MHPVKTAFATIVRVGSPNDPDRDIAYLTVPQDLFHNVKTLKPKTIQKGETLAVTLQGVATLEDRLFKQSSGLATLKRNPAFGEHTATTYLGYSGGAVKTSDNVAIGIHIKGPVTKDETNVEPNTFAAFSDEEVQFLTTPFTPVPLN